MGGTIRILDSYACLYTELLLDYFGCYFPSSERQITTLFDCELSVRGRNAIFFAFHHVSFCCFCGQAFLLRKENRILMSCAATASTSRHLILISLLVTERWQRYPLFVRLSYYFKRIPDPHAGKVITWLLLITEWSMSSSRYNKSQNRLALPEPKRGAANIDDMKYIKMKREHYFFQISKF